MEGLSIIEGKELQQIKDRLTTIELNQLTLIKMLQAIIPTSPNSVNGVQGFISPSAAAERYQCSRTTIYNKIAAFELHFKRPIDRVRIMGENCISEQELTTAMQLKTPRPKSFQQVSSSMTNSAEIPT